MVLVMTYAGYVEDYIDNLDIDLRAIDEVKDPFGAEVLSDKGLGIVEKSE